MGSLTLFALGICLICCPSSSSWPVLFQEKQLELQDRLDLASYLLKPVQRMGKYALLLKQLLQQCPEQSPDHADLKAAVEMVKFQLRHGNDLLAMDCLRECDVSWVIIFISLHEEYQKSMLAENAGCKYSVFYPLETSFR